MNPLEVWTCQRAENFKKKSSKIPKITTQQQWYRRRADKLSAAAARRSTKVGGGGAHKLSAARRGRRTALLATRWPIHVVILSCNYIHVCDHVFYWPFHNANIMSKYVNDSMTYLKVNTVNTPVSCNS